MVSAVLSYTLQLWILVHQISFNLFRQHICYCIGIGRGHPEKPCHMEASASSTNKSHFTALFLHPFISGPYLHLVYCSVSSAHSLPSHLFLCFEVSVHLYVVNQRPRSAADSLLCIFHFIYCICLLWLVLFNIFSLLMFSLVPPLFSSSLSIRHDHCF